MVKLWPWGREDTSAASFEKALSTLSEKINEAATRLESRRQRARRFKALWTLYSSFAYLLCLVLEALVVGWRNWGAAEASGLAGAPVVIYLVRLALDTYYAQRISRLQRQLADLQSQRDKTIAKLKAATRYDSTQELLEKYSGEKKSARPGRQNQNQQQQQQQRDGNNASPSGPRPQRTNLPPPPTANIPGRQQAMTGPPPQQQQSPQQQGPQIPADAQQPPSSPPPSSPQHPSLDASASFAPNAFPPVAPAAPAWYDRVLDVLMGEDETAARNRLALICAQCRLVNGLAPPGARSLADVGRWRCSACGATNGEERAEQAALRAIKAAKEESEGGEEGGEGAGVRSEERAASEESDVTIYSEQEGEGEGKEDKDKDEEDEEGEEEKPQARRSTRRRKGAKKA